eukprot:2202093-Amphidinium_carterae.1
MGSVQEKLPPQALQMPAVRRSTRRCNLNASKDGEHGTPEAARAHRRQTSVTGSSKPPLGIQNISVCHLLTRDETFG